MLAWLHNCGGQYARPLVSFGTMTTFTQAILFTDTDGRAMFREEAVPLAQGTPQSRIFKPGQHFYSADLLPEGATFDPQQCMGIGAPRWGGEPLITLFLRG